MSSSLHLVVRSIHVLGMAIALGGSVLAWQLLGSDDQDPIPSLRRFEWLFWGAIGLLVATGVGNLGTLGPPGPSTSWGAVLTAKLLVVFALVVGSAVRSLAVLRLQDRDRAASDHAHARLRTLYAGTAWSLVLVVALAEVLAHG
ncbi:CopD family protein [Halobellus captivus]|uniref:CopD family protein n=1 Tax=Halobellus captivus TaxID=2592614 RepID=UPI00119E35A3|nr:CopD family protein [Halobellus captivus]